MPFFLSLFDLFRKKLTVIGMIGQMQGMHTANSPPMNPISRIYNREWSAMLSPAPKARSSLITGVHSEASSVVDAAALSEAETEVRGERGEVREVSAATLSLLSFFSVVSSFPESFFSSAACTGALPETFSDTSDGGRQLWSLQAPYSR